MNEMPITNDHLPANHQDAGDVQELELTKAEEFAIQQFTGMHYSGGEDVKSVCVGMGLTAEEWEHIKPECEWLSEYEIEQIEEYINGLSEK